MASLRGRGQFTIEGVDKAVRILDRLGDAWGKKRVFDGLLVGAKLIRDRAKAKVRRGPGKLPHGASSDYYQHLQDSIYADVGNKGAPNEPSVISGVDIKRSPHAHLVEFGHGGPQPAPAHPYLRPAVDESRADVPRIVGEMVNDVIESIVGGMSGSGWGS